MAGTSEQPSALHRRVAVAIKLARKRYGTMRRFADGVREAIGWPTLSAAAVYAWEAGSSRVPAVALVAASDLAGVPLDHLLKAAADGAEDVVTDPEALPDVAEMVARLERRVELLERRLRE